MKKVQLIFWVIAIMLGGCATSYKPDGFSGGFSEIQLDKNVWTVTFEGNGYTRAERATELALLRSAELTLKNGFTHFVIIDRRSGEQLGTYTAPSSSYTTGSATANGNTAYGTARTTTYGGQSFFISKPSTTNTIMAFARKPDIQSLVYDAEFLCKTLGQKYEVVCGTK